ncbi:hypothetical protein Ancab_019321 [Ancistrocladus abbreviatus]
MSGTQLILRLGYAKEEALGPTKDNEITKRGQAEEVNQNQEDDLGLRNNNETSAKLEFVIVTNDEWSVIDSQEEHTLTTIGNADPLGPCNQMNLFTVFDSYSLK